MGLSLWGQGTAQINGSVTDSSGAAIPGAEIKATQTATGTVRTATSGADGGYVLPNLPIGPYLVEVSKDGFNKYAQTGIVLQVQANVTVDAAMKLGSVNEQVLVQADAAMVETQSTAVGQVVDNKRVLELPLNGRNATELVFLAGMATVGGANGGFLNSVRNYPTVMISVAGGIANQQNYTLDGANHLSFMSGTTMLMPFPDAMQEFKVEASGVTLAFGDNTVLRGIELAVEPGEFVALLGPSGCGKSTLLRLIAGFNRAQEGRVRIGGIDITDTPPWQRGVGMVFQSYALWPHMTVEQNVAFGLEMRGMKRAEIATRVAAGALSCATDPGRGTTVPVAAIVSRNGPVATTPVVAVTYGVGLPSSAVGLQAAVTTIAAATSVHVRRDDVEFIAVGPAWW